jgi:hypothetical protein
MIPGGSVAHGLIGVERETVDQPRLAAMPLPVAAKASFDPRAKPVVHRPSRA